MASVIDTGDNEVVDTIPGAGPAIVTPDGKQVYAFGPSTSDFVWNLSVIDATNDQIVATIPLDVSRVSGGVSLNGNSRAIAAAPNGISCEQDRLAWPASRSYGTLTD